VLSRSEAYARGAAHFGAAVAARVAADRPDHAAAATGALDCVFPALTGGRRPEVRDVRLSKDSGRVRDLDTEMSTQPCPRGDKGVCAIPDRTLVASGGVVTVRSREEVQGEFPWITSSRLSLQEVGRAASFPAMVKAFESRQDSRRALRWFTRRASRRFADELLSDADSGTTVLVYCSPCGHVFKTKL
jgi:hypothetical protein